MEGLASPFRHSRQSDHLHTKERESFVGSRTLKNSSRQELESVSRRPNLISKFFGVIFIVLVRSRSIITFPKRCRPLLRDQWSLWARHGAMPGEQQAS